ncbi:hypothetical protein MTO96_034295 [Rhipicephalus appendiculatus]
MVVPHGHLASSRLGGTTSWMEHGLRFRERVYLCSARDATLPERPSGNSCLRSLSQTDPPPPSNHRCARCPQSFPSARGLVNHERWHDAQDAALPGRPRGAPAAVVPVAALSSAPSSDLAPPVPSPVAPLSGCSSAAVTAGLYPSFFRR